MWQESNKGSKKPIKLSEFSSSLSSLALTLHQYSLRAHQFITFWENFIQVSMLHNLAPLPLIENAISRPSNDFEFSTHRI